MHHSVVQRPRAVNASAFELEDLVLALPGGRRQEARAGATFSRKLRRSSGSPILSARSRSAARPFASDDDRQASPVIGGCYGTLGGCFLDIPVP
jgi:hypothetical protein